MGGLGTPANPTKSMKIGITAMTTIFGAGFCFGWAPVSHVVAAELPTNRLRDVTYATGNVVQIIILFAVNFSIPYLLYEPYAALGSKVGFIFGSFAALAILFTWLCLPECKVSSLRLVFWDFEQGLIYLSYRVSLSRRSITFSTQMCLSASSATSSTERSSQLRAI